MSNELSLTGGIIPNLASLGTSKYADEKAFNEVASGASFLPRLMLMGGNSMAVKEGKINQGRYALVHSKERFDDLSPECPVLVLGWRPKALQIGAEEVISIYNNASEEFKRIATRADSGEQDTGCLYGPEFLVWVPQVKAFSSYFMSSKTARREAPQLKAMMGKPALLKCQLIKSGKFAWHGPVVTMYSQPVVNMPTMEEITEQVTRFNNPPEAETEAAPEEGATDRPR